MSKRSGPERTRPRGPDAGSPLLALAEAVADGAPLPRASGGDSRIRSGLALIADLSERLGAAGGRARGTLSSPGRFQWGHLEVLQQIGSGATSEVFRAFDPLLAVEVALKLSRPGQGWAGAGDWIAEARSLARIRHPNVVAVHGVDRHDGRSGIWLDLVQGECLDALVRRDGPLPADDVRQIAADICRGLAAIHEAGVLHCDLKPANLMRSRDGRILITDFGAALMPGQATGIARGTPLCMAPEVLEGAPGTVQSDLYSLGVVLYWLATATLPVSASSLEELIALHGRRHSGKEGNGLAGALPSGLADLVQALLDPDPRQRPASADEVGRVLAERVPTALAVTPRRLPTHAAPSGPARFDRLVARDTELAYLRQEFQRAVAGHALPVLLAGESGAGKSSVIAHLGDWLSVRGGVLLRVAAAAHPAPERLATLVRRALSMLPAAATPRSDDAAELAAAFRGARRHVVLALEDLQHADETDRAWLRRLTVELRGLPVLPVGLVRTDAGETPPVASLFGDGPVGVLRLHPFSPPQVRLAIDELLGAPQCGHDVPDEVSHALYRLTGGRPFFLVELLRHLIACGSLELHDTPPAWHWQGMPETLPSSLELALLERCRTLPAGHGSVVEAAAVLGERFSQSRLAALLDRDEEDVATALQAVADLGIVEQEAPGRWLFRHGLIQQALYRSLADAHRADLHRRCMGIFADAGSRAELAALSIHAGHAGDRDLAFRAGYAALREAGLEQADPGELQRLQELVDSGVMAGAETRWALGLARIRALRDLGRLYPAQEAAARLGTAMRPRAGSRYDDLLRMERARTAFALGEHRQVLAELSPILLAARPGAPSSTLRRAARLLEVQAQAALGDYRTAERSLADLLDGPSGRDRQAQTLALYGWCLALQDRLDEAGEVFQRALARQRRGRTAARADLLRRYHWVLLCQGRYQEAYRTALDAHESYRGLGDAMGQAKARMGLAQVRLEQGLMEEAIGFLHRTLHDLDRVGDRHCHAETLWLLAAADIRLGRLAEAETHLQRALALIVEIGDRDDEFRFLTEQSRLRRAQRRPEAALACAREAAAIATELGSPTGVALAQVEAAAAQLELGDPEPALEICEPACVQLQRLGAGERWRAHWIEARCRLAHAQPLKAVVAFARAQAVVDGIVGEFGRGELARRRRLAQAWSPLLEEHAAALSAHADVGVAERLRQRWYAG